MKRKQYEVYFEKFKYVIREDHPDVGAYLYVYKEGKCIKDILQNNVEICKEVALEKFNVPIKNWKFIGIKD